MVKKADTIATQERTNMRGGDGTVLVTDFVTKGELLNKGRLFSRLRIEPGCGIGWHIHENETEIFFIECGSGIYSDNGVEVGISAGDVTINPVGTGHSIRNNGTKTLDVIALIINN